MMILKEIELQTACLAETKAFYATVLGLPVLGEDPDRVSFRAGWTRLTFRLASGKVPAAHFAFLIPASQVAEALAWTAHRVAVLPYAPGTALADFRNWNAHAFYFHDNQGNILECIAHHDRPAEGKEAFSSGSIEGICEIGLVTGDVPAACRHLEERYGIPYFEKGPQLPDFAVMGGVEGRIIVSGLNRGWIPTGQPALPPFCRIVSRVNGREALLYLEKGVPF